ncbi:MarR family winged helix-turn-helix transcriptional regulator [Hymenobacter sp. PAMC 26628]|uniref:MarR family winged helix-turn-helix transcriptional regulator n=1 Tax=Hymenobacter sp. PAMC 26628 TaxID=1484118 RepID=UPI0007700675|nr:MarR family transcriptional regulator [Hymenobacter sp. PAMC 26628]AMJ65696.1 MarR family transcriptional regulator [Hymenobacter sp. PAMC 26628]
MKAHADLTRQITEKNLAGHVHHFSRLLAQLSEHRWAADGYPELRSGHVQLLRNLDPAGTRATVLAQRAQVTKQTMGRVVKELVRTGYLALGPDAADSRAQLVQLTPRGATFLAYLATTLVDLEHAFGRVLGMPRLAEFQAALHELTAFAEARRQQLP